MANYKRKKKNDSSGKIAHKRVTIDGITFHSEMESNYYLKLKADKEAGLIQDFGLQPNFTLLEPYIVVNGEVIYKSNDHFNKLKKQTKAPTIRGINYISDFYIVNNDGSNYVVDTKGLTTTEFEIKKKLFMALYPQYPLYVLIFDDVTNEWIDYYQYQKIDKVRKEERKAIREANKKAKEEAAATKAAEKAAKAAARAVKATSKKAKKA